MIYKCFFCFKIEIPNEIKLVKQNAVQKQTTITYFKHILAFLEGPDCQHDNIDHIKKNNIQIQDGITRYTCNYCFETIPSRDNTLLINRM